MQSSDCTSKDRRKIKKIILLSVLSVLLVFGLALFSGRATMKGESTGNYIDDSTITIHVNTDIVKDPDAHYFKIEVTTTQRMLFCRVS